MDFQLLGSEFLTSPHGIHKRLRDEAPVYFAEELGMHIVSRYDLLREILRDSKTYSNEVGDFMLKAQQMRVAAASPETKEALNHIEEQFITDVPTLLTLDRPKHTVYRSLVEKLFTASRIKSAGPSVQKIIDEVIAAADGDRSIEFISRIAFPIPVTIIFDLLGVPEEHREAFELGATI